jgi:hypothetical protein
MTSKWIELTSEASNNSIMINTNHIVAIINADEYTRIVTTECVDSHYGIRETYEEVVNKIKC